MGTEQQQCQGQRGQTHGHVTLPRESPHQNQEWGKEGWQALSGHKLRPQEAKLDSAIRNAYFPCSDPSARFLHTPLADLISAWASLLGNSTNAKIEQFAEI